MPAEPLVPPENRDSTYLAATRTIESSHPEIVAWAREKAGQASDRVAQAVALFYAVRDGVRYDPYSATLVEADFRASVTLARKRAFCVPKAILLAAGARALGIPSRLAFADVRNHLASDRLLELMRTDLFVYHGYTELYLGARWVKATPTFDAWLCKRFGVEPLEFDGQQDSVLHPFDAKGRKHMEYVADRGTFADFPFGRMVAAWKAAYPHFFAAGGGSHDAGNDETFARADEEPS